MMHGYGWGGFIGMILIWILLIAGSIWLVKALFSGGTNQTGRSDRDGEGALEILKKRYARGEVDRDEFERMKQDLTADE